MWTVKAGKPIAVVFQDADQLQHNLVITKPGALEKLLHGRRCPGGATGCDSKELHPWQRGHLPGDQAPESRRYRDPEIRAKGTRRLSLLLHVPRPLPHHARDAKVEP
jgi:hypothetical protein